MALQDVEVTPLDPERFRDVLSPEGLAQFERTIARGRELLADRIFWNVNSTAHGGGVAEMLRSLIGYARGVDIDARWVTIGGNEDFFRITKRLHNRLHGFAGDGGPLGDAERAIYEAVAAEHADLLAQRVGPGDVVLLHDPQTAGMVGPLVETGVPVIWRSHVGLDVPNDRAREAWRFLIGYVERADAYVFSRPAYTWEGLDEAKVTVIPPVDRRVLAQEPRDVVHLGDGGPAGRGPGRRPSPALAGDLRAPRRQRGEGRALGARRRGVRPAPRRAAGGPGLALGQAQGPDGHRVGLRRARARRRAAAPAARGPRRHGGGRRSRGRGGLRGDRGGMACAAPAGPPARASRPAADGRGRRERGHRQRAAAPRRRRGPEEPRRGLRAHGLRGDVEGPPGRGVRRRAASRTRSRTGAPATSSNRPTSPPSPTASIACSPTPTTPSAWARPPRRACATCSSARAIWASTWRCWRACSSAEPRGQRRAAAACAAATRAIGTRNGEQLT